MKYTKNPARTYYRKKTNNGGTKLIDKRQEATPKELAQLIIDAKIYVRYNGMDNGGWTCHVSSNHQRSASEIIAAKTMQIWGTKKEHRELEKLLDPHIKVFPREYEDEKIQGKDTPCDECGFCINDICGFCKWDSHINTEYVLRTWKK